MPNSCNPMDCSLPGFSVHGDSPDKNTGVGCHGLLQGIFPTHGSNPGLLHCRQILYHLSNKGIPKNVLSVQFSSVQSLSRVRVFAAPWNVLSRQEYWSGLPFPSPGDLLDPGIKPGSPAFQADTLTSEPRNFMLRPNDILID